MNIKTASGEWGIFVLAAMLILFSRIHAAERVDPFEQVKRMGRGVNIIGYDPLWQDPAKARFKEKHFKLIKDGGFGFVRINLHAFDHMEDQGDFRLEDSFINTLDWAVQNATEAGLMVLLDLHNFTDFAKDPARYKPKFLAFWRQIAPHYQDAPSGVIFEMLNEPNGLLTPPLWNIYLREALAIIRESNPERTVVIGPGFWNGIDHLAELELPEGDRNLIVTVHYYLPMEFTHQGAPWSSGTKHLSGIKWGSDAEKRRVEADFKRAQKWAQDQNRPLLLGEFGAYDKGEMAYRAAYTAHVARTAESLGWAWAYWQFDSDFIVYDIDRDQWVEPIHKALIP